LPKSPPIIFRPQDRRLNAIGPHCTMGFDRYAAAMANELRYGMQV